VGDLVAGVSTLVRTDFASARRTLGWQLLLVYASLASALWTAGIVQVVFIGVTALLATVMTLSERRSLADLGLDPRSVSRGWWIVPVGAALGGLILLAGWRWHTLRLPADSRSAYSGILLYVIWALIQQFLLQSFMFLRLEQLLRGGRRAVIAAALLFASAHIPNPVLVPVTLVGGLILSELFRRYRTIYLLAVAQALVALALAISVPEALLHDMRVGIGYISYSATHH
jgi:Type II CAAX prenyl endopeptidase Rce1-like